MTNRNRIKNWAITFPQTECERETFVDTMPPYDECICAREEHKEGGFHLHLGITLKKGITKRKLLDWIKLRWPKDYKRIDVQPTRSIKLWSDYIQKEDPVAYKVNKKQQIYEEKAAELLDTYFDKSRAYDGAVELKNLRTCSGCDKVCQECEHIWEKHLKMLDM